MSEHLRSAEDVAWEALSSDDYVLTPHEVLSDLIRARDAEVREAARAEALAGFEWQHAECQDEYEDGHCHDSLHVVWRHLDLRPRRLVGPWEPTP